MQEENIFFFKLHRANIEGIKEFKTIRDPRTEFIVKEYANSPILRVPLTNKMMMMMVMCSQTKRDMENIICFLTLDSHILTYEPMVMAT